MNRVTLKTEVNDIPMSEMRDGEIAVLTKFYRKEYIGKLVQRYGGDIILLGRPEVYSFKNILSFKSSEEENRVRILQPGETITIN